MASQVRVALGVVVVAASAASAAQAPDPSLERLGGSRAADTIELPADATASIAGRILRPDGTPAPAVQVIAARRDAGALTLLPESRTTAAWDGRYRLERLSAGAYLVVVEPGVVGSREDPVPVFPRTMYPGVVEAARAEAVTVIEGVPTEGIDVWLTPARRFRVSGRVYWPDGVNVEQVAIEYGDPAHTHAGLWLLTDPGGLFSLTDVPPGPLVLLARAASDRGPLTGIAATAVTVDAVEDVAVVLDTPGSVHGRVVYDGTVPPTVRATRATLRQTLMRVSPLYPAPTAPVLDHGEFELSGAQGEYTFVLDGLPSGFSVLRVLRDGGLLPDERLRVAARERVTGIAVVVGRK
jgi:hypothetical protein